MVAVGPWIPRLWEMLGLPDRIDVRAPDGSVEPAVPMWTYWYLQEGEVALAPSTLRHRRRRARARSSTSTPTPACTTTRAAWSPTSRGASTSSPTASRSRAAPSRCRSATSSSSIRIPTRHGRAGLPGPLVRGALALHGALRGLPRALPPGALGRRRRLHRRQLPGLRPHAPNVYVAADSNHGYKMIAVGREIARVLGGRALVAAAPVPLRALRDRRPAPGLAQPVPVELRPAAGHVVVGGGVLGLSAAWRLAERGADVLVLEKDRIGAGASGAAGGIVRNFYRAPAITDVVRMSVEMFEAEPEAFGFRQVGYLAAVPEAQVDDLIAIRAHHEPAGTSPSSSSAPSAAASTSPGPGPTGRRRSRRCCTSAAAAGPTRCAPCATSPTARAAAGAKIDEGVEVTGFELGRERGGGGADLARAGRAASRRCSLRGRGRRGSGRCSGSDRRSTVAAGAPAADLLLEGAGGRVRAARAGAAGRAPATSRRSSTSTSPGRCGPTRDGAVLVDGPWGIYFRIGAGGASVTGGGLPVLLVGARPRPLRPRQPRPRGRGRLRRVLHLRPRDARSAASAAAPATGARRSPAGSSPTRPTTIRSATGWRPNAYAIVDSGHGFKLLALGRLAADDVLDGEPLLEPFRLSRFERGETHPASQGPYPWT